MQPVKRQTKLEQAVQAVMLDPRNQTTLMWWWEDMLYGAQGVHYTLYLDVGEMRFERYSDRESVPPEFYPLVTREGMQLSLDDLWAYAAGLSTKWDFGYAEIEGAAYNELVDYLDSIGEYND